eukprot:4850701-Amphidinium_carterae.1
MGNTLLSFPAKDLMGPGIHTHATPPNMGVACAICAIGWSIRCVVLSAPLAQPDKLLSSLYFGTTTTWACDVFS